MCRKGGVGYVAERGRLGHVKYLRVRMDRDLVHEMTDGLRQSRLHRRRCASWLLASLTTFHSPFAGISPSPRLFENGLKKVPVLYRH